MSLTKKAWMTSTHSQNLISCFLSCYCFHSNHVGFLSTPYLPLALWHHRAFEHAISSAVSFPSPCQVLDSYSNTFNTTCSGKPFLIFLARSNYPISFYSTMWLSFYSTACSEGKVSTYNAGDWGLIPGSGRSPGEGNGNPIQYSCLENSMDWEAWWATVHGVAKSRTRLSDFTSL